MIKLAVLWAMLLVVDSVVTGLTWWALLGKATARKQARTGLGQETVYVVNFKSDYDDMPWPFLLLLLCLVGSAVMFGGHWLTGAASHKLFGTSLEDSSMFMRRMACTALVSLMFYVGYMYLFLTWDWHLRPMLVSWRIRRIKPFCMRMEKLNKQIGSASLHPTQMRLERLRESVGSYLGLYEHDHVMRKSTLCWSLIVQLGMFIGIIVAYLGSPGLMAKGG